MKNFLVLTFTFIITTGIAFADMFIAPDALPENVKEYIQKNCSNTNIIFAEKNITATKDVLPENAKKFIQKNFPNAHIMYAEKDYDSIEVKLSTGVEMEFDGDGEWHEIESYVNFPTAVLPAPIVEAITKAHPLASIIKAEKTWNGFEIKTNNMMEIYITEYGQIIGQKFDD